MEILVTGADGLLGSNLVRELLNRNYKVTALVQSGSKSITLKGLPINFIEGDLLNLESLIAASEGKDIIYHCAASTSMFPPRQAIVNRVNIEGTENVVHACKVNKVKRLIYVGTANSFSSGPIEQPGTEKNTYSASHYGLDYMDSKYNAQKYILDQVKTTGLDAVVMNPTFMIGPYDSAPSSGKMILRLYQKKIPGYSLGGKNFVAVKDVAVAMANAITMGKTGECYLLSNENLSYKEAFHKIAQTINAKEPTFKLTNLLVKFYGKTCSILGTLFKISPEVTYELAVLSSEHHYYSSEKAVRELEMPQTPIEHAILDCFNWFKENNYLTKK